MIVILKPSEMKKALEEFSSYAIKEFGTHRDLEIQGGWILTENPFGPGKVKKNISDIFSLGVIEEESLIWLVWK